MHLWGQRRLGCAEGQGRTETRPRPIFSETPQNGVHKDAAAGTALEKSAQTVLAEAASPGRCSCGALSQGASPGGEEGGAPHAQTDAPAPAGAPALLRVPAGPGARPAPPAASVPLRHSQTVGQKVLPPRTPVARAEVPAKLSPFGARGCFALKTRASTRRRLVSSSSRPSEAAGR